MGGWGRRRQTLGLVLSGGGARGAFHVGVYERLLADPRFAAGPAVLSGTSAGAINAALIAAGKTPAEMMQFWQRIADDPPVAASDVFFRDVARRLVRLGFEEAVRWLSTTQAVRTFLWRARNHLPPRRGGLLALWVEYLLTERGRDFRPVLWALLAWGNKHFAPEGASVVIVDRATGAPADPVLVDRLSGRVLAEPAFRSAAGPAADERTRRRHEGERA